MALTLNVNSYVDVDAAENYFETRLDATAWYAADDEDKESSLVTATQLLDELAFIGSMTSLSQSLAWPRSGVQVYSTKAGSLVTIADSEIPKEVKTAVFEMALHLLTNQDILNSSSQTLERIKVGPIEIEDSAQTVAPPAIIPARIKNSLKHLLVTQGSKMWWRNN